MRVRSDSRGLARAFLAGGIAASCSLLGIFAGSRIPGLQQSVQDSLFRVQGASTPSDDIALVTIDEKSIAELGRFPWPRAVLAQIVDSVSHFRPKEITLDVLITDPTSPAEDQQLADAVARAGNVVVAAELAEDGGRVRWLEPLPVLARAAAGVGHVQVAAESDGAARSLLAETADDEGRILRAAAIEAVRVGGRTAPDSVVQGDGFLLVGNLRIPVLHPAPTASIYAEKGGATIRRSAAMPIHYIGPAGAFASRSFSASDVLHGHVPAEALRGAYVLIGATASSLGGKFATPFVHAADARGDEHGSLVSGVEVLANSLDTILRNRFYTQAGEGWGFLLSLMVALGMLLVVQRFDGLVLAGITAAGFGVWLLVVVGACSEFRIFLPAFPVSLSFFSAGACGLIWRSFDASAALDRGIHALESAQGRVIPMPGMAEALRAVCGLSGIRGAKLIRAGHVVGLEGWSSSSEASEAVELATGVQLYLSGQRIDPVTRSIAGMIVKAALDADGAEQAKTWPQGLEAKARAIEQVQRRVAQQMAFLTSAFGSVEDGILTASPDGIIRHANPKAAALLSARELTGRNLVELLFGAPSVAMLGRLLVDRVPEERQIQVRGRVITVRLAAIAVSREDPAFGIVASLSDVTRQHELAQTKDDVINLVSHEMRTPLTAIQGMTELLSQYEIEPARRKELHLAIHDEVKRMGRMISEYLDLTRLEAGKAPVQFIPMRIEPVIDRAVLMFEPLALQKRIRIESHTGALPPFLGDPDLLTRALQNLISNAVKYSAAGTVVDVAAALAGPVLALTVSDQGPGIPEPDRERIFEKFYRVPRLEDADTPGTGLGLALVREVAVIHGGTISVTSNEAGRGSRFTLELPLKPKGSGEADVRYSSSGS